MPRSVWLAFTPFNHINRNASEHCGESDIDNVLRPKPLLTQYPQNLLQRQLRLRRAQIQPQQPSLTGKCPVDRGSAASSESGGGGAGIGVCAAGSAAADGPGHNTFDVVREGAGDAASEGVVVIGGWFVGLFGDAAGFDAGYYHGGGDGDGRKCWL